MQIRLLNGDTIDTGDVFFNTDNLAASVAPVFNYIPDGSSLDNLLPLAVMREFDGFDSYSWNRYRAAHPIYGAPVSPVDLPTDTAGILADQLLTNPLAAPLDALTSGVKQFFANAGIKTLLGVGIGVVALVLLVRSTK